MKTGKNAIDPDHNNIIKETTVKVATTPTEATLGHTIGTTGDTTGVVCIDHAQALIHTILTAAPHIKGHLCTGAHQLTQEITADQPLDQHTGQLRKPHFRIHHIPKDLKVTHTKRNPRVKKDDPQMDFYSPDDNSSGSEEDSDHLN